MDRLLHRIGWIGLTVVGAFLLFAVTSDLIADRNIGIPADHEGTFSRLSGMTFGQATNATPGLTRYISVLETGYALHELTFAALFVAIVVMPLRRRQRWAWWACWALMVANLGYTFTFGVHDSAILRRSLIADIAVPVLLLIAARPILQRRPEY